MFRLIIHQDFTELIITYFASIKITAKLFEFRNYSKQMDGRSKIITL